MAAEHSAETTPASSFSSRAGQNAAPALVLIVDDVASIRLLLSRYVRGLGHRVVGVENGQAALERLRTEKFDLVLLDVMMPEMDGYAVLGQMKADEQMRDIPVIVVSGVEELQSVVRCLEHGAEDYVHKPFNPTLLKARVSACLQKKRLWDERQENYRRLQELEALRDSLTHMVVHDLRTPLTALLTGLRQMEALGELSVEQRECWEIALQGGETLLAMINDLLDISKMEAGAMELEIVSLSPANLVERAMRQVEPLAREKGLALATELDAALPPLIADEEKLLRTVVNLLSNAIKFTPAGGTITLAIRGSDDEPALRFSVTDTGEGIPREAFERIFDKFGQVETRQAGRKMSTGLGLTFCKMVVEAHGGRIGVESEPGRGSTFFFHVPRRRGETAVEGADSG